MVVVQVPYSAEQQAVQDQQPEQPEQLTPAAVVVVMPTQQLALVLVVQEL